MENIQENRNHSRTCTPFLKIAIKDSKQLDTDEYLACYENLQSSENELLFGEIILMLAKDKKASVTDTYFGLIWPAACVLEPLFDLYVWEITEDMVNEFFQEQNISSNRQRFCRHWIKWARESEYNRKKPESEYGLAAPTVAPQNRQSRHREFVNAISFPPGYKLPRYAHFSTVFKYWVWLCGADYSEVYLLDSMCVAYDHMEPLHDIPFWKVRPDDVRSCMHGLSQNSRNLMIVLYRSLDKLACEQDIIQRRHSLSLSATRTTPVHDNEFSQNEIDVLSMHIGEIEVDMTMVLLYTGLTAQEICSLRKSDVDGEYIHIDPDRTSYSHRDIPIHPVIIPCLFHVMEYLNERDSANVSEKRRRLGIGRMVNAATEKYCDEKHSPENCRSSFAARLREAGAGDSVIEYLHGTRQAFLRSYQRAYAHPSSDRIYAGVMNMR